MGQAIAQEPITVPNRILASAVFAAAVLASGSALGAGYDDPAPGYHDTDRRPCISENELKALEHSTHVRTRAVWEARWEITGTSYSTNVYEDTNPHMYQRAYKSCGYPLSEQIPVLVFRRSSNALEYVMLVYPQGHLPHNNGPTKVAIHPRLR